jgi:ADP-ribose pyrophosphatase
MARSVEWEGKYLRLVTEGDWEWVERTGGVGAVVILAQHDGKWILIEQDRKPLGRPCLELPAGLVGDEDDLGPAETAIRELEEETGFRAARAEPLGEFHSSPGMASEGYTLVRMHGVRPGGDKGEDGITVHLVAPEELADFVAGCRARGLAVDGKLLLLLAPSLVG